MIITNFIDNNDHYQDPFLLREYHEPDGDKYEGSNDLSRVQRDIASFHLKQYIPLESKDPRFAFSLAKIQGCAAFSIKAYFLKPSENFLNRWLKGLCIFALPAGYLIDIGVNTAQFSVQSVLVIEAFATGVLKKIVSVFIPKKFLKEGDDRWLDLSHTRCFGSLLELGFSVGLLCVETPLMPLYYLGWVNPLRGLKHSYWVFDLSSNKYHLVLDQEKVKWLQKKYGYTSDLDALLKLCPPANPAHGPKQIRIPCCLKLNYDASGFQRPEDIRVQATWTSWQYAYSLGNVHYYNSINNIHRTHPHHDKKLL